MQDEYSQSKPLNNFNVDNKSFSSIDNKYEIIFYIFYF